MFKRGVQASIALFGYGADGGPVVGLSPTATVSKDGGAFGASTNAITEIGNGLYQLVLTATEMTAELVLVVTTATGAMFDIVQIHTEADYTATRAGYLDAAITSRLSSTDPILSRILGVHGENSYTDNQVYDAGKLTSARMRLYNSAVNAAAHGATGLLATYNITATYDGSDNLNSFLFVIV